MSNLNERRAIFVYEAARLEAIAVNAPIIPKTWSDREDDFREQFIRIIERQMGKSRSNSPEELHDSWMQAYWDRGWVYGETYDPDSRIHPDLVPYTNLSRKERDKDAIFIILCKIARLYIYDRNDPADSGEETNDD